MQGTQAPSARIDGLPGPDRASRFDCRERNPFRVLDEDLAAWFQQFTHEVHRPICPIMCSVSPSPGVSLGRQYVTTLLPSPHVIVWMRSTPLCDQAAVISSLADRVRAGSEDLRRCVGCGRGEGVLYRSVRGRPAARRVLLELLGEGDGGAAAAGGGSGMVGRGGAVAKGVVGRYLPRGRSAR